MDLFNCPVCWDKHRPWCDGWDAGIEPVLPPVTETKTYLLLENADYKVAIPCSDD